jgi:hypothetical protein
MQFVRLTRVGPESAAQREPRAPEWRAAATGA